MDEIIKAISGDGSFALSAISSKELTERARMIHKTTPVVTAALGRTLAAASLIGSSLKKPDASLTVNINGGGPVGTIIVVSDFEGNVRGYVQNPFVDLPKNRAGKLDVGRAVGRKGMLSVIKDFGEKEPYSGASALVSGEIAEDFAAYFTTSEQIPTACAFGVLVDRDASVLAAGGYIVQLLPGAPDDTISRLEGNITMTGAVTGILLNNGAEALVSSVMYGFSPRILERRQIVYKCTCSRERFLTAVMSLDDGELDDIIQKGEPVEVKCQFCESAFTYIPDELIAVRRRFDQDLSPKI